MSVGEAVGVTIFAFCLCVASVGLDGFVLGRLWAWYASEQFGLPMLSVGHAAGLCLLVRFATRRLSVAAPDGVEVSMTAWMTHTFGEPLAVLAIGALLRAALP